MPTIISGSTGINQIQDGTIVQADLAPNVSGTPYILSAIGLSGISLPAQTWVRLQFGSKDYEVPSNGWFDLTTSKFTPTIAGYYSINLNYYATGTGQKFAGIFKNVLPSQSASTENQSPGTTSSDAAALTTTVYLNGTTDYIIPAAYSVIAASTINSYSAIKFQAYLVRAA